MIKFSIILKLLYITHFEMIFFIFKDSDFNWPQAAMISSPLGDLTGLAYPARLTILAKESIRFFVDRS